MAVKIKADRAKLFIPFDALKGFKEALLEKEKVVSQKKEVDEEKSKEINDTLLKLKKRMLVEVIYFKDDEYLVLQGLVSHIDLVYKELTIIKTKIPFEDIYSLEIKNLE